MRKLLRLYTNWRNDILFILFAITTVLFLSESDTWTLLLASKGAGCITAYLFILLFRRWDEKGLISDLTSLAEEE